MPIKLTSTQYKIIAVIAVIAVASALVSVKYFSRAFPEAALQIRVNRDESTPIAEKFMAARGFNLAGYRHAAIFSYDDDTKLYLERTQGLERMNQLARGPIHIWRWSHRWFRPQQKEEFRADVTPAGDVVAFDHEIPESAPGANLDQASARAIAEQFLASVMKRDLQDLEFVEAESNKRPARTDYTFTWKQKSVSLGDGSLRLAVDVDGDQVAALSEFVKIPEQWSRDYEKLRSRNNLAQIVDESLWIVLCLVMVGLIIKFLRERRSLPVALSAGAGVVAAALYLLNEANTFSLTLFSYQTTDSYSSFVTDYIGRSVVIALVVGGLFFLLMLASEPIYHDGFPAFVSLRRTLSWQGLRTRSFLMANVAGIGLTFFFFAYQTIFYLAANKLGAWAPSEPQFSDDLNTRIPWVGALFIGFIAAVSEEMQFRAFAIPFLKKITHSWVIALVLAAFNWGFLHSAYPNQPFFIRGLEVGTAGVITGLVMLRFGVVATLIWHYSVDALYSAFLMLRSPNHYLVVSGAITAGIMLVPLSVALVAYWRSGTFTDEAPLTNGNEVVRGAPEEPAAAGVEAAPEAAARIEPAPFYRALDSRRLALAGILIVIFGALAFVPAYRFGSGIKTGIDRRQAIRAAGEFLKQRKVPFEDYHRVAWLEDNVDALAVRYLLERRSVQQTDQIYRQATRLVLWHVRYFKPLEKEEYLVFVDATNGRVFSYRHPLDEDAPGATLSGDQARALAEQALGENGYRLSDFELQDHHAEKRKAREDYTFTWQAKLGDPRNVGDEHYRVAVDIAGDQVVAVSRYFKLPEDWERQREGTRLANAILIGVVSLLGIALTGGAIALFVVNVRAIPWRASLKVGIFLAVVAALGEVFRIPTADRLYQTSVPLRTFTLLVAVGFVILPLLAGLAGWLLAGLAVSLYPDAWGVFRSAARRVWRRDAAVALVLSLAAGAGLGSLEELVGDRLHAYAPVEIGLAPPFFDTWWPAAEYFLQSLMHAVFYASMVAVVIYLVRWSWKRRAWWIWPCGLVILASLGPTGAHSWREYFADWALSLAGLVVTVGIVAWFFRSNALAYVAAAFCLDLAPKLRSLLEEPPGFYFWNGLALAGLTVIVLAWLFAPRSTAPGQDAAAESG